MKVVDTILSLAAAAFALITAATLLASCTVTARKIQVYTFIVDTAPLPPPPPECSPQTINGVTWAAANVDDYQTFATRPDMHTKFYKWGGSTAWSATDSTVSRWNSTVDTSSTWTVNPCPDGWRLPTVDEIVELHNRSVPIGGTWANAETRGNAVAGRFYGTNSIHCSLPSNMQDCIFLPAAGGRFNGSGSLDGQGSNGIYWSSTQNHPLMGCDLDFGSSYSYTSISYKANGMSVRCVQ